MFILSEGLKQKVINIFIKCVHAVTSVISDSLWNCRLSLARPHCPWDSPGKTTRVGCHFLLQGIFQIQKSNLSPALAGRFCTIVPPGKHMDSVNGLYRSIPSCSSALLCDIISLIFNLLLTVKWTDSSAYLILLRRKWKHACEVPRTELIIIIYNLMSRLSQCYCVCLLCHSVISKSLWPHEL